MTNATTKQVDYLLTLANKITGQSVAYPSQNVWLKARMTMAERSGRISKVRASALIDEALKEQP